MNEPFDPLKSNELARAAIQKRMDAGLPAYRTPLERAADSPKSLRCAINAHCFQCIGEGHDPDWRGAIRDCEITECALHPHRPYQEKK